MRVGCGRDMAVGRVGDEGRIGERDWAGLGDAGPSKCESGAITVGEGDCDMNGSTSSSSRDGVGASDVSATLSLLDGLAKGLLDLSEPSCDGLLTKGDCLSGESIGDADFAGGGRVLVGDVDGDAARMVDGDRANGDGRGENDILLVLSARATLIDTCPFRGRL